MNNLQPVIALILGLLAPNSVLAQSGGVDIRGIGLIDLDGTGGCSGSLIAPDLVLTAAHCLTTFRGGTLVGPEKYKFSPTLPSGIPGHAIAGKTITIHPIYQFPGLTKRRKLRRDIALLRLRENVPGAVAEPLITGPVLPADKVGFLVSFRGLDGGTRRQRSCPYISVDKGFFEMGCDVQPGESGAPVLAKRDGGLVIVGVVSSRSKILEQPIALVVDVDAALGGLMEAQVAAER